MKTRTEPEFLGQSCDLSRTPNMASRLLQLEDQRHVPPRYALKTYCLTTKEPALEDYVGLLLLPEPKLLNQASNPLGHGGPEKRQEEDFLSNGFKISLNPVEMNLRYRVAKKTPPNARGPSSVALCSLSPKNKGLTPISCRIAFSHTRRRPHHKCLKNFVHFGPQELEIS